MTYNTCYICDIPTGEGGIKISTAFYLRDGRGVTHEKSGNQEGVYPHNQVFKKRKEFL